VLLDLLIIFIFSFIFLSHKTRITWFLWLSAACISWHKCVTLL